MGSKKLLNAINCFIIFKLGERHFTMSMVFASFLVFPQIIKPFNTNSENSKTLITLLFIQNCNFLAFDIIYWQFHNETLHNFSECKIFLQY